LSAVAAGGAALIVSAFGVAVGACGGQKASGPKPEAQWPEDDRTLCEWKGRSDVHVLATPGLGSYRPTVRRVFKVVGDKDSQRLTLECREADTNLDGLKDVARFFDSKGDVQREVADTNFDGKVDAWIGFVNGKPSEEQFDVNGDGKPDVWKSYSEGVLARIRRDRNFDGKVDVWEVYVGGKLERVGVDDDGDGKVDRWDRDLELVALSEAAANDGGAPEGGSGN
jgi:hypothetical protein